MPYINNKFESSFAFYTNQFPNHIGNTLEANFAFLDPTQVTNNITNELNALFRIQRTAQIESNYIENSLVASFGFVNTKVINPIGNGWTAQFVFAAENTFLFMGGITQALESNFTFKGGSVFELTGTMPALQASFGFKKVPENVITNALQSNFLFHGSNFKFEVEMPALQARFSYQLNYTYQFQVSLGHPVTPNKWFRLAATMPALQARFAFENQAIVNLLTYSFNIRNNALSTYTNWGFLRLVRFKGVALGIKENMLYTIGGSDKDAGVDIAAYSRSHFTTISLDHLSRVYAAYIKLIINGDLNFGIMPDSENLYKYRLPLYKRQSMQLKRVDIGRGLIDTDYAFYFENVSGSKFMIQSIALLSKEQVPRV